MSTIDRIAAVLVGYQYLREQGTPHATALAQAVTAAAKREARQAAEPEDDKAWQRRADLYVCEQLSPMLYMGAVARGWVADPDTLH
jgi:hypothetical protein